MIRAYYNDLTYIIYFDNKVIYQAGNSPYESQSYLTADEGVGLETMKEYCTYSANHFRREYDSYITEISYQEEIELNE